MKVEMKTGGEKLYISKKGHIGQFGGELASSGIPVRPKCFVVDVVSFDGAIGVA